MRLTRTILLTIVTLQLSTAFSQITDPFRQKNEQLENNRINQKVKSIRTYAHALDAKGKTNRKGELLSEVIYNERGLSVKTTAINRGIIIISETEYNAQDKAIKITRTMNGKVTQTKGYEYDASGKLETINNYRPDGTLSSSEDVRGRNEDTETITYNAKGEVSSKTESAYNSETRVYTSRVRTGEGKLRYENNYQLDENNRIIESWMVDDTGAKRSSIKYSYNDLGNEVEQQVYTPDGSLKEKNLSVYNEKNLKIEFTRYQPADTKTEVIRYEYTYY